MICSELAPEDYLNINGAAACRDASDGGRQLAAVHSALRGGPDDPRGLLARLNLQFSVGSLQSVLQASEALHRRRAAAGRPAKGPKPQARSATLSNEPCYESHCCAIIAAPLLSEPCHAINTTDVLSWY